MIARLTVILMLLFGIPLMANAQVEHAPKSLAYRASSFGLATTALAGVAVAGVHTRATVSGIGTATPFAARLMACDIMAQVLLRTVLTADQAKRFPSFAAIVRDRLIAPTGERVGYGLAMYYDMFDDLPSEAKFLWKEYIVTGITPLTAPFVGMKDYVAQFFTREKRESR
jgi:hypothetical protein